MLKSIFIADDKKQGDDADYAPDQRVWPAEFP